MSEASQDLEFDSDVLRAKYRQERDKRLRDDGNDQYLEVSGRFAHFVDDPYVESAPREPLADDVEVVVVGGGFGGLLAGARLREAGVEDIRIIEKGGDFGGTWYWNRYPGAQCDIESYIYLPLLEELGYVPKEKYSFAPEILAHARAIGEKYRLYDNACFQTEDTDGRGLERITERGVVANGKEVELDCLIFATGFEVGTAYTRRAGYDVVGRVASSCPTSGRKACVRCTASKPTAFRTVSSWA